MCPSALTPTVGFCHAKSLLQIWCSAIFSRLPVSNTATRTYGNGKLVLVVAHPQPADGVARAEPAHPAVVVVAARVEAVGKDAEPGPVLEVLDVLVLLAIIETDESATE